MLFLSLILYIFFGIIFTMRKSLFEYKKKFKELKTPHRIVANLIGCSREHTTRILNGLKLAERKYWHIKSEFDNFIRSIS